jgi:hypothetical protein
MFIAGSINRTFGPGDSGLAETRVTQHASTRADQAGETVALGPLVITRRTLPDRLEQDAPGRPCVRLRYALEHGMV